MSEALAVQDAEVIEVEPVPGTSMTLFGTDDPVAFIQHATAHAKALAEVVEEQKLYKQISGNKHVKVQGWTLLGSMLGVFPVEDGDAEPVEIDGVKGFKASVKAVTRDGSVVGRATAYCMYDEPNWRDRKAYALASMAQTRATSKALRQPLDFVMTLAGFNATPAEEMPSPQRGRPERPKTIKREEAIAELKERQPKLARLDKSWKQDSIFSHVAAQLGTPVKKWEDMPDEAIRQWFEAARKASSGIEEAVGIESDQSEFKAPEGVRGQAA